MHRLVSKLHLVSIIIRINIRFYIADLFDTFSMGTYVKIFFIFTSFSLDVIFEAKPLVLKLSQLILMTDV